MHAKKVKNKLKHQFVGINAHVFYSLVIVFKIKLRIRV